MMQINLDTSQIDKFEKKVLQKAKAVAFPLAIKGTLNSAVFQSRTGAQKTIEDDFTLRNKFTKNSVRVVPVRTLKIDDMVATVGGVAPYMLTQEEGKTISSKGKRGLRIPTGAAAGQTTQFPRKKVIKKRFRRGQLKLSNTGNKIRAKSKEQWTLMSIRVAALRGRSPYIFLGGKKAGVYKVIATGSSPTARYKRGKKAFARQFKWGKPRGKPGMEKLLFIHSYSDRSVTIPPSRFLEKNVDKQSMKIDEIFRKEADRIFNRFVK